MKRNSRLALALHTLGHMAVDPQRTRTSTEIAEHAGTNPVVVRRVLGTLREAGLLSSEKGHAGGWRLARGAHSITLADVYIALGENLVTADESGSGSDCSVENALHHRISAVIENIEQSLISQLSRTTIAEVQDLEECACRACVPAAE